MTQLKILIVDDEAAHRLMLSAHLKKAGYVPAEAANGEEALERMAQGDFSLVLLDLKMPGMNGLEVLERMQAERIPWPVIIMTAYGSIDSAVRALKMGAQDYLTKPLDTDELMVKIEKTLKTRDLAEINVRRARNLSEKFDFSELLGESHAMLELKETLALVAPSEATVLIVGESGSGKELVAKAVHKNSPRASAPFIAVNCAALPETLLESELFGHEKGAFTGAHQRKVGRFELADHGTLFLDEIGEMSAATQAKLLRVIETQSFERLGGTKSTQVDVRIIAATNRDLEAEIEQGGFREDLYYRLNVVQVRIPTLKERGEPEIIHLAQRFLAESAARNNKQLKGFKPTAVRAMAAYAWPGNVRELVNAVERAVILSRGDHLELEDLPLSLRSDKAKEKNGGGLTAGLTIKQVEAELIERTLAETSGNRTKAASMLGITRQTLLNKIKEYDL